MSHRDKETVARNKEKIWSVKNQFPDMSIKDIANKVELPYSTVYQTLYKHNRKKKDNTMTEQVNNETLETILCKERIHKRIQEEKENQKSWTEEEKKKAHELSIKYFNFPFDHWSYSDQKTLINEVRAELL